jgi:hypothetical protein
MGDQHDSPASFTVGNSQYVLNDMKTSGAYRVSFYENICQTSRPAIENTLPGPPFLLIRIALNI